MNPYALWRCMVSELPGGYSTVSIRPSLPGRFVRSFDRSRVTLASCAAIALDITHASAKISFVNVISEPFADRRWLNASCVVAGTSQLCRTPNFCSGLSEPVFEMRVAEPCVIAGEQGPLAESRSRVERFGISNDFAGVFEGGQTPPD